MRVPVEDADTAGVISGPAIRSLRRERVGRTCPKANTAGRGRQARLTGDEPLALAHVDCDWYDSVRTCLERIVPRLVPGGVLVIDDYYRWSGCRSAVDDYFATQPRKAFRFRRRARLQIVRQ